MTDDNADITVTTATRTEDQVRADFDVAPPAAPVVETVPPAAEVEDEAAVNAELDQQEPPAANETPEQQTARRSRATKKVLKEIALRKTAETEREALRAENAALKAAAAAPKPPTPPSAGAKKTDVSASAAAVPAAPVFTFDSFGDYEATHDGATYEDYIDARTDARAEFIDGQKQVAAARVAAEQETRDRFALLETSALTFKEQHADYDDVVGRVVLDGVPDGLQADLQRLLLKAGDQTPAILYHLGTHPEDAKRLLASPTRGDLTETFGELKALVKADRSAADAAGPVPPAKPTKPVTGAPAPLNPVPGASVQSRTLAQVAEVDDDADAYIERRKREQAGT